MGRPPAKPTGTEAARCPAKFTGYVRQQPIPTRRLRPNGSQTIRIGTALCLRTSIRHLALRSHPWKSLVSAGVGSPGRRRFQGRRDPALEGTTLFGLLKEPHPGRYQQSQLRMLHRQITAWRPQYGPGREVIVPQMHEPGEASQPDFTQMSSLNVTLGSVPFRTCPRRDAWRKAWTSKSAPKCALCSRVQRMWRAFGRRQMLPKVPRLKTGRGLRRPMPRV
jgi:hypothetical protein